MRVQPKQRTDEEWGEELRKFRTEFLHETQDQFGTRFNATAMAVSYWEKGTYAMPSKIIVWMITGKVAKSDG